jgi:hypothetical protein
MAKKTALILILVLILAIKYDPVFARVTNNQAFGTVPIGQTQSNSPTELYPAGAERAQTIKASATETWDGIVLYLDRMGLISSTDSMRVRFGIRHNCTASTIDTSTANILRTVYIKITDIPDGDVEKNTLPPDTTDTKRGYAIWVIFPTPVSVTADTCYFVMANAPQSTDNQINWHYGYNGYGGADNYLCAWYNEGSWVRYSDGVDFNFRVIRDKYALVDIRRYPFNDKGVLTISSDIDHSSVTYLDSLHRWLNTSQNVGGSWGQGLNGNIAGNDLWFGRASTAESTGTYTNNPIPFYFHGLDTTSAYYKDTIDNFISRRWMDVNHGYVACDGTDNCADSLNVLKWLNYMLNRPTTFDKIYAGGVWVNHGTGGQNTINIGFIPGETGRLGDSTGTIYHHAHRTLAPGKFKFIWHDNEDPGTSSSQYLQWINWQSMTGIDSLNMNCTIFDTKTLRDGVKTYMFDRIGRSSAALPESLYKFINLHVARQCVDSNWVSLVYTHLGKTNGLTAVSKDSIRAISDSAAAWKLWIPGTKSLLNQQAASAFSQLTVDRPANSKRRINITSLYDWSWGSHVPNREELYYLTFIAYAPESLIVTINAADTLRDSNMTAQQDVPTNYNDVASGVNPNRAMSWVGTYNRTAGRKTVIYGTVAAPPEEPTNLKKIMIIKKQQPH